MAAISDLVALHGLGIRVWCGQQLYPRFTVIKKTGERQFRIRYDDGQEGEVDERGCDYLNDYEVVEPLVASKEG